MLEFVVAGATLSGIAAVAGWLVLGGRRERAPGRVPTRAGTTITLVDGIVRIVPESARAQHYTGRVPPSATPTLWRAQDDRPRWLRRMNDQQPRRTPVLDSPSELNEDPMPWLAAVTWPSRDASDVDDEDRIAQ